MCVLIKSTLKQEEYFLPGSSNGLYIIEVESNLISLYESVWVKQDLIKPRPPSTSVRKQLHQRKTWCYISLWATRILPITPLSMLVLWLYGEHLIGIMNMNLTCVDADDSSLFLLNEHQSCQSLHNKVTFSTWTLRICCLYTVVSELTASQYRMASLRQLKTTLRSTGRGIIAFIPHPQLIEAARRGKYAIIQKFHG